MSTKAHNATRIPTLEAILSLNSFTTAQLEARTGFTNSQIRPIVAALVNEGYLTSTRTRPATYELTSDVEKRRELAEEVQQFQVARLQGREWLPGKHYFQAVEELDRVERELRGASSETAKAAVAKLEELGSGVLELAAYECNLSLEQIADRLAEDRHATSPPVVGLWARWRDYLRLAERLQQEERPHYPFSGRILAPLQNPRSYFGLHA